MLYFIYNVKTACIIILNNSHYEYLVLLYGLTNVPSCFRAFVNKIFHEMINHFVFMYIEYMLINFSLEVDGVKHIR